MSIITWHFASDISNGCTTDGILVTKAVTHSCIILHVAYNSSRNAAFIFVGSHCALFDVAVGDDSVTAQTSGNTAHTRVTCRTLDGHILHTETSHCTGNNPKETHKAVCFYLTIAYDMSTAIVIAIK